MYILLSSFISIIFVPFKYLIFLKIEGKLTISSSYYMKEPNSTVKIVNKILTVEYFKLKAVRFDFECSESVK